MIDRRFDSINKQQETVAYLMNCLRYRVIIALNDQGNPDGVNQSQGQSLRTKKSLTASQPSLQNRISLYDTLLELLEEFDSSGRAEIFRLLLERRSAVPLFLPNGEHHLPMFKLLTKTGSEHPICLGEDVRLLRLAVISCRKKEDSKTAELLKEVFHIESLHREDFSRNCFTREMTTAEIGLGCVLPQDGKKEPVHLLVLNVVGDFDPLWDFIKGFSDYLIIEDAINEEDCFYQRRQFSKCKGSPNCPGLEGIDSILVWKSSTQSLQADYLEAGNEFGFGHLQIKTSLCKSFYDNIVTDLLDPKAPHSKSKGKKIMLHEMTLPIELKGVECSVSFDIKSSVGKVKDFSTLRTEAFLLQKSFNDQAKVEEEQAQNKNDESIKNETERLIQIQKNLRKQNASKVEKHHLLELFLKQLSLKDISIRVLGFRELEKSLAFYSEKAIGPLRTTIDNLSSQYAELSQSSKSSQNDKLDRLKKDLQKAKDVYNTTVVSTEHLWRELSHLYAADPSKYSKSIAVSQ